MRSKSTEQNNEFGELAQASSRIISWVSPGHQEEKGLQLIIAGACGSSQGLAGVTVRKALAEIHPGISFDTVMTWGVLYFPTESLTCVTAFLHLWWCVLLRVKCNHRDFFFLPEVEKGMRGQTEGKSKCSLRSQSLRLNIRYLQGKGDWSSEERTGTAFTRSTSADPDMWGWARFSSHTVLRTHSTWAWPQGSVNIRRSRLGLRLHVQQALKCCYVWLGSRGYRPVMKPAGYLSSFPCDSSDRDRVKGQNKGLNS